MKTNIDINQTANTNPRTPKNYPYPQENNFVTGEFENMLVALFQAEVNLKHTLGLYADICRGMDENPDVLCRKYIGTQIGKLACAAEPAADPRTKLFEDAVQVMKRISVLDFMRQHHAEKLRTANNSGVENGYIYESFFESVPESASVVIVDAPPHFVSKMQEDKRLKNRRMTLLFSDERIEAIYRSSRKISTSHQFADKEAVHSLIFVDDLSAKKTNSVLEGVQRRLVPAEVKEIHLYLPSSCVDGAKRRKRMHAQLVDNYGISRIGVIESPAFCSSKRNHCVLVLQGPSLQKDTIPFQRVRLAQLGSSKILIAEKTVNVQTDDFRKGNQTIAALLERAGQNIAAVKVTKEYGELRFEFSPEMIGYGSVHLENYKGQGMYRLHMNMYGEPNARQTIQNKDGRGSALTQKGERSTRKKTYQEAVGSATDLLEKDSLRQAVCKDLQKREKEENFSLFSFWFLHSSELEKKNAREREYARSFFFHPGDAWIPCKTLPVHTCTSQDIEKMVETAENKAGGMTPKIKKCVEFLKRIFALDVKIGNREDNPCDPIWQELEEYENSYRELRKALGLRSQTMTQNRRLWELLLEKRYTKEHGLAMGAMICFLTGMEIWEACDLTWECLHHLKDIGVYQFVVGWKRQESNAQSLHRSRDLRCVPLCELLREELLLWRKSQVDGINISADIKLPIVSRMEGGNLVSVSQRSLTNFIRKMVDSVGVQVQNVPIPTGTGEMKEMDINKYYGPWLRANFDYSMRHHAQMVADDQNYIMGRSLKSTDAKHYRDYQKNTRQLAMKAMIDRWAERLRPEARGVDHAKHNRQILKKEGIAFCGQATPVQHFIVVTPPIGEAKDTITLTVRARHGLKGSIIMEREVA